MNRSIGINVNIGSSETQIFVTGHTGTIHSQVLAVAGNTMEEAITRYLEQNYNLLIGKRTANLLKSESGTSSSRKIQFPVEVRGRRLISNVLETVFISDEDVQAALADVVKVVTEAVTTAVDNVPAEISTEVLAGGILLKDNGNLPKAIDQQLMRATGLTVRRV